MWRLGGVEQRGASMSSVDSHGHAYSSADASATTARSVPTINGANVVPLSRGVGAVTIAPSARDAARGRTRAKGRARHLRLRLVGLDAFAVACAWAPVGFAISDGKPWVGVATVLLAIVSALVVITALGLYRSRVSSVRARELSRLVWVGLLVPVVPAQLWQLVDYPNRWFALVFGGFSSFLFLVVTRSGFDAWLRGRRGVGEYCRDIAIIGTNTEAVELYRLLDDHKELGYRVVGFIGPLPEAELPLDAVYLGDMGDVRATMTSTGAGGVIVAAGALGKSERRVVNELLAAGYHVHCSGGMWGIDHRRVTPLPIGHEPLFYIEPLSLSRYQLVVKRALDIVISSLALLLVTPVMLVCALIIKLADGGPVFFRQERIGSKGVPFIFYKLRSMVPDAHLIRDQFDGLNLREGPLFKAENDPRITRFGQLLRMSSLDELPQLLNVLKGDMSLVGPRPALAAESAQFDEELSARHSVRPGISGLWQVEARDNPSFAAYKRLDLFYVENWSVALDLVILVLTAQQVTARIVRALWGRVRPNPSWAAS